METKEIAEEKKVWRDRHDDGNRLRGGRIQ